MGPARDGQDRDGKSLPAQSLNSLPVRTKAVVLGSVAAVLAGSICCVLIAERWAYSHGEVRAARQATTAYRSGISVRGPGERALAAPHAIGPH